MVVENKIERLCCFYVSDYHLEMILLPYISKKINEKIIIKTEKNLRETVKILVSKTNLSEEEKEKILNLGWDNEENKKIEDKSNIIIIGNKDYIDNINIEIKEKEIKDATIVDCYDFEESREKMEKILNDYKSSLNTMGIDDIRN